MTSDHRRMLFALIVVSMAAAIIATPARLYVAGDAQDADVVRDFEMRVERYAAMHRGLEGPLPAVQVSIDMSRVRAAMDALAAEIQAERKDAQRGDIFGEDISRLFRKRIAGALTPEEWAAILMEHEEADPVIPPSVAVNGRWPQGMPFNFVPPQLLATLPKLPPELEYRIVGRSLVLWDHHADLIVDFIPGAFTS